MDAAGKDGTIRHVMSGVNPQGCTVSQFKVPSHEESEHDYLWRAHKAVPERGKIGIFNRSHYEDVLVVRVHKLVAEDVWKKRYEQINQFESLLTNNTCAILKFYLHISKDEQKKRFQERLDDPSHQWKLSPADLAERKYWNDYMDAYEAALTKCGTEGCAVVHHPLQSQMVPESRGFPHHREDASGFPDEVSEALIRFLALQTQIALHESPR